MLWDGGFFFLSVPDHYVGTGFAGSRCTKHPEKDLGLVLVIREAAHRPAPAALHAEGQHT